MTLEDQHKLAVVRLLLHKPRWIVLDEAIDHVDDDTRSLVLDVFGQELAEAAIVNIGQAHTYGGFFTRVLHLIEDFGWAALGTLCRRLNSRARGKTKSSRDLNVANRNNPPETFANEHGRRPRRLLRRRSWVSHLRATGLLPSDCSLHDRPL